MPIVKKYRSLSAIERDIKFLSGELEARRAHIQELMTLADMYRCKSDEPTDMCRLCSCWKRTREMCS